MNLVLYKLHFLQIPLGDDARGLIAYLLERWGCERDIRIQGIDQSGSMIQYDDIDTGFPYLRSKIRYPWQTEVLDIEEGIKRLRDCLGK